MEENKSYEGKIALLVDDDIDLLEQLKMRMETMGFSVITAESQAEAEKLIETENFDLAVFDLMLENPDGGFVLSYKVKQKCSDIPVIIVTGVTGETGLRFNSTSEEYKTWTKADVVLDKDIRYEQLQREIDRLLK